MASYYHRWNLKATEQMNFDLKFVATTSEAKEICKKLMQLRAELLRLQRNANEDVANVVIAMTKYLSLLSGFVVAPTGDESKLRTLINAKWTQTLAPSALQNPSSMRDAVYEQCSMMYNVAFWYMKHSSVVADQANQADPKYKDSFLQVYRNLRIAAGLLESIRDQVQMQFKLKDSVGGDSDLSSNILDAYVIQCKAEAQEVGIIRALEASNKQNADVVYPLCMHTEELFAKAATELTNYRSPAAVKLKGYLRFKEKLCSAYKLAFYADVLLGREECGEALACIDAASSDYEECGRMLKVYKQVKFDGTFGKFKPENFPLYSQFAVLAKGKKTKFAHENGFIYHQKVPDKPKPVTLDGVTVYGVVEAETFTLPPADMLWTPRSYQAFDITKHTFQS